MFTENILFVQEIAQCFCIKKILKTSHLYFMPKMRKWRERSNVLMSYLKKFGIWIKMKKNKTNKPMHIRTKKD